MVYKLWTLRFVVLILELVTLFVVFDTFTTDVGSAKAFTWHPILMTAAFAVFMNEGLVNEPKAPRETVLFTKTLFTNRFFS